MTDDGIFVHILSWRLRNIHVWKGYARSSSRRTIRKMKITFHWYWVNTYQWKAASMAHRMLEYYCKIILVVCPSFSKEEMSHEKCRCSRLSLRRLTVPSMYLLKHLTYYDLRTWTCYCSIFFSLVFIGHSIFFHDDTAKCSCQIFIFSVETLINKFAKNVS